ncbi:P-loop containing nucleoside triphosphate hydrolase protein [Aspergillus californicus]
MVLCQYEKLHKRNQVLEQENILLRRVVDPESFQGGPPFYQVLYRFKGSDKVFFRPPTWAREDSNGQTRYILKGDSLSMKESEYLNKSKSLAFAIYKTYTLESLDGPPQGQGPDVESWPLPNHESETLSFTSKQMVEAVRKYLGKLPDHAKLVQILDMKEIPAPYLFWYHIRSSYQSTLNDLPKHQRYCTDLLAEWMTDNYEAEYKLVDEQISRGVVTCASMIYLMRPGEILVAQKDDHLESHMCTSWAVETTPPKKDPGSDGSVDSRRVWEVRGWSYEFDGSFYRKEVNLQVDMDVQDPTEEVELQKLNVIPLRCADPEVRKRLERRGKTYWECREKKFVSCSGSHSFESLNNSNERFMIDSPTYQLLHQDDQKRMIRETRRRTGILPPLVEFDDLPPAPDLYLFPSTIVGYNLRTKKWGDLEVDMIHKVDWNKSAFDNLVVDEETKELIRALITNRLEVEKGTDMIDDKGNGLIILLHGGPGTGKTFTAESVAELAEKPLYRVTCGDIGTKPEEVEQYLESALHLGKIWDCVVLLDEADVFLQERTLSDLKRNALVTVFLRVLEYYNGIMILTSNRVGTFDEAFKSRIQLALHYPNLTRSQRYKIWRNFISRLKKLDQPNINFDDIECYLGELADMDMNGRQIRNAITTARQLAKYRGRRMTHADLKHVINVAGRFDTYLSGLNEGLTDDAIARESGLR